MFHKFKRKLEGIKLRIFNKQVKWFFASQKVISKCNKCTFLFNNIICEPFASFYSYVNPYQAVVDTFCKCAGFLFSDVWSGQHKGSLDWQYSRGKSLQHTCLQGSCYRVLPDAETQQTNMANGHNSLDLCCSAWPWPPGADCLSWILHTLYTRNWLSSWLWSDGQSQHLQRELVDELQYTSL